MLARDTDIHRWGATWAFACSLLLSTAQATQVVRMNLKDLAQRAEVIAVGRCTGCSAAWNESKKIIYSTVTIQVREYVKGFAGPELQFRQLGGTAGGKSLQVPGMPEFTAGQEVVVFLAKDSIGKLQVLGMKQGKFKIVAGEDGMMQVVAPRLDESFRTRGGVTRGVAERPKRPVELSAFLGRVRDYMQESN